MVLAMAEGTLLAVGPVVFRLPASALALLSVLLGGCLSFSPHEVPTSSRSLRAENQAWLEERPEAARLRFAVIGDVQRGLDETAVAVERMNEIEDLAFVVQLGDFTDLGLLDEFELMAEVFDGLEVPWFAVIGNHDLLGNGGEIFDTLLGPRNHDFTHQRTRFVFLDTNSREYAFRGFVPDLDWLAARLAPSPDHDRAVVFSHVAPSSHDFDPALREPFVAELAAAGVALSFHAHEHRYETGEYQGVPWVIADSAKHRSFLIVDEQPGGELAVRRVAF